MEKTGGTLGTAFSREIFRKGMVINLCLAVVVSVFLVFFIMLSPKQILISLAITVPLALVSQFVVAPKMHRKLTEKISAQIDRWQNGELATDAERTDLFEQLVACPAKIALETFLTFLFDANLLVVLYLVLPVMEIGLGTAVWAWTAALYGSYITAIFAYMQTEGVVNRYAEDVVKDGLSVARVIEKKCYGLSFTRRCLLFLFVPFCCMQVLSFIVFLQGYFPLNGQFLLPQQQVARLLFLLFLCSGVLVAEAVMYSKALKANNENLCAAIKRILGSYPIKNSGSKTEYIPTSLSGKMQYNIYLLNVLIGKLTGASDFSLGVGSNVMKSTSDLAGISKDLSVTVGEQSQSLKDILSMMSNTSTLAEATKAMTARVSEAASTIMEDLEASNSILTEGNAQISGIFKDNEHTLQTIEDFSRQVENIDDIVALIRDIAEQTKIIAFNAELEAVASGAKGRNFHIIAAETRRLANSIMESIGNIQEHVDSIQESVEKIRSFSEEQTKNIKIETDMVRDLVSHFDYIKGTAELTADKTSGIASVIDQQSSSFSQLAATLKQIDSGLYGFSLSVHSISELSEDMKNVAESLGKF